MHHGEDQRAGKRRIVIMALSIIFMVATVGFVTFSIIQNLHHRKAKANDPANAIDRASASRKAILSVCQLTDHKQQCVENLQAETGNTTDPKELIRFAFQVAKKHVVEAAKTSTALREHESDPRANLALQGCKELMDEASEDLQRSFDEMGKFEVSKIGPMAGDLKSWLSAAITYQETCLDGFDFENMTSQAGEKMRKALKTTTEHSINAIAMVNKMPSLLGSLDIKSANTGTHRRLLENNDQVLGHGDLHPSWLDSGNRRLLSMTDPAQLNPMYVVAKDGSGNCTTINEALNCIPKKSNKTITIYIKEGIYHEKVFISRSMNRVFMVGDGADKTRITGRLNYVDGTPTMRTATVSVLGEFFMAKNIGFENSAGPRKHQAVALRVDADKSIFYNCSMEGYQDTLYAHAKRQYYRDCTISGTIDFVFGDASALFQNCKFMVRRPGKNQRCVVTAQGRNFTHQPTGIVIQNSSIVADPKYYPVRHRIKSYLGRPWRVHSRTVIMETFVDDLIQPEGWLPWEGEFGIDTCFYAEYNNYGPGANKTGRVTWKGLENLSDLEAMEFTAGKFLDGDAWIKPSGVPYSSGFVTQGAN